MRCLRHQVHSADQRLTRPDWCDVPEDLHPRPPRSVCQSLAERYADLKCVRDDDWHTMAAQVRRMIRKFQETRCNLLRGTTMLQSNAGMIEQLLPEFIAPSPASLHGAWMSAALDVWGRPAFRTRYEHNADDEMMFGLADGNNRDSMTPGWGRLAFNMRSDRDTDDENMFGLVDDSDGDSVTPAWGRLAFNMRSDRDTDNENMFGLVDDSDGDTVIHGLDLGLVP